MKKTYIKHRYTPDRIESLREGEIFVFGSNLAGHHGGGAANIAFKKFGAIWGQGYAWNGTNLLGFALMEVMERLKGNKNY